MEFTLKATIRPDGTLVIAVPRRLRVILGGILVVLLLPLFIPLDGGANPGLGLGGGVAVVLVALGLVYEERWVFKPAERAFHFRFGLLFVAKKARISFDQVEEVRIESFFKGKSALAAAQAVEKPGAKHVFAPKPYISLVIYLKDSGRLVIETTKQSKLDAVRTLGREITLLLGTELKESPTAANQA